MRDRIDAAAFGLGVVAFLHLSIGMRLFAGYNWWWVLFWAPNWRVAVFHQGVFAVVGLLVYWLRLRALGAKTIWYDVFHDALTAGAAPTTVAVFLVLYLAVGVGLYGHGFTLNNAWLALTWPYQMIGLTQVVLVVLASFVGVSLFAGWLKDRYLFAKSLASSQPVTFPWAMPTPEPQTAQTGELEAKLAALQDEMKVLRDNLDNSTRQAAEARMRAAAAEAKLSKAESRAESAEKRARRAKQRAERAAGDRSPPPDSELAALREEVKTLRGNLENETRQAAQARMRAAEAEAKLREQNADGSPPSDGAAAGRGGDAKFKRLKRAFSKMYHPDTTTKGGKERMSRVEFYKEFYQVLEAIDDDKPLPF